MRHPDEQGVVDAPRVELGKKPVAIRWFERVLDLVDHCIVCGITEAAPVQAVGRLERTRVEAEECIEGMGEPGDEIKLTYKVEI